MADRRLRLLCLLLSCALFASSVVVQHGNAAHPSDKLLPQTTKGYISVPSVATLREKWQATQMGQLANDPVMKPFVDDLQRQIRSKLSQTDQIVGITWDDLDDVSSGEVCIALIQPWDAEAAQLAVDLAGDRAAKKAKEAERTAEQIEVIRGDAEEVASQEQERKRQEQCALVVLLDVTDQLDEAQELLEKITAKLLERGATRGNAQVGDINMSVLNVPIDEKKETTRPAYYCIHQDMLLATDNQQIAAGILARMGGDATGSLSELEAYQVSAERAGKEFEESEYQFRWFAEPFGLVEVVRAYAGGRKKRGTDVLKVLANQGFKAVQGIGGCVALSTGEHELLHRSLIYAPPVERQPGNSNSDRYDLAARMLNFPNSLNLQPQTWVARELATYFTFNWKMREAFWHAETLVNEFAGDDVFRDVLKSIETDPNGPRINIEEELISHLAERATVVSDCRLPITPKSERLLVAIELTDPDAVMRTVNKAMESDPEARKLEHNGQIIWEMISEDPVEVETVEIDFGFDLEEFEEEEEEEKPFRPNAAVTVTRGHLVIASHVDYIVDLLDRPEDAETLEADGEYQLVAVALDKLGSGEDSFRLFTRTDEAYRTTYELVRQGKMPEAESLLGKALNYIFEPEEEGVLREQYIDGSQLPEYQVARRYLGPAGLYLRSEEDGWSITGCLLNKEAE